MSRMNLIEAGVILLLALATIGLFAISNPEITGFAVMNMPDYQKYKPIMSEDAFKALSSSFYYEKKAYIISTRDYEKSRQLIEETIPAGDIKQLRFIDAVAVKATKPEIMKIMDKEPGIMSVYLDKKIRLLRSSAKEMLNITNIRLYGPQDFNRTGKETKIAVIDTGIDYTHPEFNCTPGRAGCFIKRGEAVSARSTEKVSRNSLTTRFSDNSQAKVLHLEDGSMTASIMLRKNATINKAQLYANDTNITVYVNEKAVPNTSIAGNWIDFKTQLQNSTCAEIDYNYCAYNLTFASAKANTSAIEIKNLSLNTTFTNLEPVGDAMDAIGHGTMVAGILHDAAKDAELYAYKVFDDSGNTYVSDIILGIELAILDDVDIISMSIGSDREIGSECAYPPLEEAIDKAYDSGILPVIAGGNNVTSGVNIPACFNHSIAIAAIDDYKNPAASYSHGQEIDFAMPGIDITSTSIDGEYATGDGTSFATPFAASVFALVNEFAMNKTGHKLLPWQYKDIGRRFATDIYSTGFDNMTGYGILMPSRIFTGLTNNITVIYNPEIMELTQGLPYQTVELYSIGTPSVVTLAMAAGNITVGNISAQVRINHISGNATIRLSNDSSSTMDSLVYIDVNLSSLTSPDAGTYTTTINITNSTYNISLSIPVNYVVSSTNVTATGLEYTLGTFAIDDTIKSAFELIIQLLVSIFFSPFTGFDDSSMSNALISSLSPPSLNYMRFFAIANQASFNDTYLNFSAFENNPYFNVGYCFLPIIRVNASTSSFESFAIRIYSPSGDTRTLFSTEPVNMSSEEIGYNSTGTNFMMFTYDGQLFTLSKAKSSNLMQELLKLKVQDISNNSRNVINVLESDDNYDTMIATLCSDSYTFPETGTYNLELYGINGSRQSLINKSKVYVYSNMTVTLRNGYAFLDQASSINFDVLDSRGYYTTKLFNSDLAFGNLYLYNATLIGIPNISISLQGLRLSPNISTEMPTVMLASTNWSEGSYDIIINYSLMNNTGSLAEKVSLVYAPNISANMSGDILSGTSNLTLRIRLSKKGTSPANISSAFKTTNACISSIGFNESSFNLTGFRQASGTVTRDIGISLIPGNITTDYCYIRANSTVSGLCYSCNNMNDYPFSEALDEYVYIDAEPTNVTLTPIIDDDTIVNGESVTAQANIRNDDLFALDSTLYANISNDKAVMKSVAVYVLPGENETYSFVFPITSKGTKNLSFLLNSTSNGNATYASQLISVSNDYITITPSLSKSVHENESADLIFSVTNNNNDNVSTTHTLVVPDNYAVYMNIYEYTDYATIPKYGTYRYVIPFDTLKFGTMPVSAIVTAGDYSGTSDYDINILPGVQREINMSDYPEKYKIGMNDTVLLAVNDRCDKVLEACNKTCKANETTCKKVCTDELAVHKADRDSCRQDCNGETDSDEKKSCKEDCQSEYLDYEEESDDCKSECADDRYDCSRSCEDDFDDCMSDQVVVTMYIDEIDNDTIYLEADGDNEYNYEMKKGDIQKFDFNDDGLYESQVRITNLYKNETNPCQDAAEADKQSNETACDLTYDACNVACDDKDCRSYCRDDKTDCIETAKSDYDDAIEECTTLYTHYELEVKYIQPPEPVPETKKNTSISSHNNTNQPKNNTSANNTAKPTCADDISLCMNIIDCQQNYGYWYDDRCNSLPLPEVETTSSPAEATATKAQVEETTLPPKEEEITVPPKIEFPKKNSNTKFVVLMAVISVMALFSVAGYIVMKNTKDLEGDALSKKQQLAEYFMKQLLAGYEAGHIEAALVGLGWEPGLTKQVLAELTSDKEKMDLVRVFRFAKNYGIKEPNALRGKFPDVSPNTITQAMEEFTKEAARINK